jgi:hypothetical protein
MHKLLILVLFFPLCVLQAQRVGINTTSPQATLHIGGNFKFTPKTSIDATRLVAVTATGAVKEFALGANFLIVDGTLVVDEALDENIFLVGDVDQSGTPSLGQYDNYDIGIQQANASNTIIRVTGETSGYNVTGFQNGYHGRIFYFYNAQSVNATFMNRDNASDFANQIHTGSGGNVNIVGQGVAEFIYDGDIQKWILINVRN